MSAQRLYPIQPFWGERKYPVRYYPGVLPDGSQVLMRRGGLYQSYGLWFTSDGWLREFRFRYHDPTEPTDPVETQDMRSAEKVFTWQEEISCRPGLIRVHQFVLTCPVSVVITDYSAWMTDWVDSVDELASEELAPNTEAWEQRESLKDWRATGKFTLCWEGTEFILDGEGNPAG